MSIFICLIISLLAVVQTNHSIIIPNLFNIKKMLEKMYTYIWVFKNVSKNKK